MKPADYGLLLGAALVLLFVVKKATAAPATPAPAPGVSEIDVGASANGWRYFTDGTAISPDGAYFYQGDVVYDPLGMYKQ